MDSIARLESGLKNGPWAPSYQAVDTGGGELVIVKCLKRKIKTMTERQLLARLNPSTRSIIVEIIHSGDNKHNC